MDMQSHLKEIWCDHQPVYFPREEEGREEGKRVREESKGREGRERREGEREKEEGNKNPLHHSFYCSRECCAEKKKIIQSYAMTHTYLISQCRFKQLIQPERGHG